MGRWMKVNENPAGRNVGDCAVRAVAVALGTDWETAYRMICKAGLDMADMPSSNSVWGAVLRRNGFYRTAIPNTCPDCYTLGDFADDHPNGTFVVCTGNHVATTIDGVVYDSWYSLDEVPQFFWYRRE